MTGAKLLSADNVGDEREREIDRERQRQSIACFSLDSRTSRGLTVDVYLYLEMLCSLTYNNCHLAGFRKF